MYVLQHMYVHSTLQQLLIHLAIIINLAQMPLARYKKISFER